MALALPACDFGREETFGTYETARLVVGIGGQTVDLLNAGGSLVLDLYGSGRGGVDGEARGVFLIPGELLDRSGFTLRVSYLGTYTISGDRVVFGVRLESSDALRSGEFTEDGPALPRAEAEALLDGLVTSPTWTLRGDELRVEGDEIEGTLRRAPPDLD